MARTVRILGAGLSGLSAAVNLALNGISVVVLERRSSVGMQIKPNFQVLHPDGRTPQQYLESLNLRPSFRSLAMQKIFFSTCKRDLDLDLQRKVYFIQRGGVESLECGLYRQALDLGVEFKFNEHVNETDADVIAYGPRRIDAVAYGEVYECDSFESKHFFMMYDDRYSPRGWYAYAVPYDGKLEVINCASQPYVSQVKELFKKAVAEKKLLRDAIGGRKPCGSIGGFGNAFIPKTAVKDGRLRTGEAAGFQDPFRGFGMKYALESGKMAADAIAYKIDYDALWKEHFMPKFKLDYSRRFFMSVLGSGLADLVYRKFKSGQTIEFVSGNIEGPLGGLLKTGFLQLELLKRRLTGCW
jgi:flavin-dependent dehydrogenase